MAKPHAEAAPLPHVPEFVREAIREKAARELAVLEQRSAAIDAATHARVTLDTLTASLAASAPALAACADASILARAKKLRKSIADATSIATEITTALGGDASRDQLAAQRLEIEHALASVGIVADVPADTSSLATLKAAAE